MSYDHNGKTCQTWSMANIIRSFPVWTESHFLFLNQEINAAGKCVIMHVDYKINPGCLCMFFLFHFYAHLSEWRVTFACFVTYNFLLDWKERATYFYLPLPCTCYEKVEMNNIFLIDDFSCNIYSYDF